MKSYFHILILGLGFASAGVASAQDGSEAGSSRTPEKAMQFLVQVMPTEVNWGAISNSAAPGEAPVINGPVSSMEATSKCTLRVNAIISNEKMKQLKKYHGITQSYFVMDFSLYSRVSPEENQYGEAYTSYTQGGRSDNVEAGFSIDFHYPDKDYSKRVSEAIRYLGSACDKSKGLGF